MQKKEFNYGLSVLKMVMCFEVICIHCCSYDINTAEGISKFILTLRDYAVPVFMIISFLFVQTNLVMHDNKKMKDRFLKLILPQIGWGLIYGLVYFILESIVGYGERITFKDILLQILTGHRLNMNPTMWFQIDLILTTSLFLVVIILAKKHYEKVIIILGIMSLLAQYIGINLIFMNMKYEFKYPIGRMAEMIPLATIGFILSSKNVLDKMQKHRIIVILVSLCFMIPLLKYGKYIDPIEGYGYQGISRIAVSLLFVSIFSLIPINRLGKPMENALRFITKYTLGIYCMHRLVSTILDMLYEKFSFEFDIKGSFTECILIYTICFLVSWIGASIFRKTKIKLLFD